jgi:hypothetical protein
VRTGGEEELVDAAVVGCTSAEFNAPELIDEDIFAVRIPDRTHILAGDGVEGVNGTGIRIIRDQQCVAQLRMLV